MPGRRLGGVWIGMWIGMEVEVSLRCQRHSLSYYTLTTLGQHAPSGYTCTPHYACVGSYALRSPGGSFVELSALVDGTNHVIAAAGQLGIRELGWRD